MEENILGRLIRDLREDKKLTQAELAKKMKARSPSYISMIEKGIRPKVSRETILSIAKALDLNLEETDFLLATAG